MVSYVYNFYLLVRYLLYELLSLQHATVFEAIHCNIGQIYKLFKKLFRYFDPRVLEIKSVVENKL